jgi:Ca2+-binding RTX toxin-like protein
MADIKGTVGADTLEDTTLQDVVMGGGGNDTIRAGAGDDVVYGGSGDDEIWSYDGNDTVYGGSGNDSILDLNGDDLISGGSGDDLVLAGEGNDTYTGGSGYDTINFIGTWAGVTVDLSKGTATGMGTDIVQGFEALVGSMGDDTVKGSKAAETIDGNYGNDVIRGLGGADTLMGGGGDDTFHWKWSDVVDAVTGTHLGVDVIKDFEFGDRLNMADLIRGQWIDDPAEAVRLTDVDGGTLVQAKNGDAFYDVVIVSNISAGELGDGGLLL